VDPGRVSEAGIVDEDLDAQPEPLDRRGETVALGGLGEVGGDRLGADAGSLGELARQLAEPILPAGDQDQPVPTLGQEPADLAADARGGAGDQRGGGL
jgi:hypothetical protein